MESRTFSGDGPDTIIQAVNAWLAGETGIAIRDTQTRAGDPGSGTAALVFEVWYERKTKTP